MPRPSVTLKRGIEAKIQPLKSSQEMWLRVLLYGASKTGKTTLWSTFPGKILALICSGGNEPGELKSIGTEQLKKIDSINIESSQDLIDVFAFLQKKNPYKTIVLDHVSGLQDLILKEILNLDEIPVVKTWGLARMQDYGECTVKSKTLLRAFLNIQSNTVIIGQEREFESNADSELVTPTIGVALMPGLAGWVNSTVDYIAQTFKAPVYTTKTVEVAGQSVETNTKGKGVNYCLRVGPHEVFTTGFRIPKERNKKLPEYIIDPTYKKIMELIN